jgi:hypothetical protein
MIDYCRSLLAISLLSLVASLPAVALAGGRPAAGGGCPPGTVCDSTLGVAVTPPPGWFLLPRSKFPPHTLAFGRLPNKGLSYNVRLIIQPYAVTSVQNDARSAQLIAAKLIRAERATSVTQLPVRFAGSPGLLLRGLPGGPGPALDIVLAHQKAVYLIIAPGTGLAADQRQALASMRLIPRTGHFLPQVSG